jgi:hypothetical protein
MMWAIRRPRRLAAELDWAASVVMDRVTDHAYRFEDGHDGEITIKAQGRTLVMPALLPDLYPADAAKLPRPPFPTMAAHAFQTHSTEGRPPLPILLGTPEVRRDGATLHLGADLFGAAFLLLSGYQEACDGPRDAHDRFPGSASLQTRGGFILRPLVDEYAALLQRALESLLGGDVAFRRAPRTTTHVSCDVDHPFDPVSGSIFRCMRATGADLLLRRSAGLAARRLANMALSRAGIHRLDPYNTFDWYMDQCERRGHQVTFFILAGRTPGVPDGSYEISDPRIRPLLQNIHRRGHRIGLHGSYMSCRSLDMIVAERRRLAQTLDRLGITAELRANRQHYLRWDALVTPDLLDAAGFAEDHTGGFADACGFRFGTAFPFRMWSWARRSPLRLMQRPLLLMEQTILRGVSDRPRMNCLIGSATNILAAMADTGGEFQMLWHNSMLLSAAQRQGFAEMMHL